MKQAEAELGQAQLKQGLDCNLIWVYPKGKQNCILGLVNLASLLVKSYQLIKPNTNFDFDQTSLVNWLNKFGLIPKEKFDSVDLVWYDWSVNLGLVYWGWYLVKLYHLSKPKTNFAFHTIKVRPALVDLSQKI